MALNLVPSRMPDPAPLSRPKDVGAPLPVVPRKLVNAVLDWLRTHHFSRRPPEVAAGVLALAIVLHRSERPFPHRALVAEWLNATVFGIDHALNVALTRGCLRMESRIAQGNVQARESVVRQRYYIPCEELLDLADSVLMRNPKRSTHG